MLARLSRKRNELCLENFLGESRPSVLPSASTEVIPFSTYTHISHTNQQDPIPNPPIHPPSKTPPAEPAQTGISLPPVDHCTKGLAKQAFGLERADVPSGWDRLVESLKPFKRGGYARVGRGEYLGLGFARFGDGAGLAGGGFGGLRVWEDC
ncbi:hypothetical protein BU26DRAFT_205380 [Trematosphaeria pertusa]|uniref:Uncharacterized protein n=1 Tax=Trematosphaeria pertusa TaxID=390896 RepID=A0A6A6HR92_9PLEO|nr:uncharacterized protein BU26DRAFT_205380 [Trematosphaeria pertusa]KAF2240674.1 hypothetical protein BU26DRAFT_205380 [Trematosphaeria pertusa]